MNSMILRASYLLLAMASTFSFANSSVIGQTYPITEKDALNEVKENAAKIPKEAFFKSKSDWAALQSISLPLSDKDNSRKYIPWHTTQFDIKDPNGKLLYPKGFRFNPLQYVKLPQRIVVIREDQAVWLKESHLRSTDMVLITDGDLEKTARFLNHPVFILDQPVRERLNITHVPSFVIQEATYFLIETFKVTTQPIPEKANDKDIADSSIAALRQ